MNEDKIKVSLETFSILKQKDDTISKLNKKIGNLEEDVKYYDNLKKYWKEQADNKVIEINNLKSQLSNNKLDRDKVENLATKMCNFLNSFTKDEIEAMQDTDRYRFLEEKIEYGFRKCGIMQLTQITEEDIVDIAQKWIEKECPDMDGRLFIEEYLMPDIAKAIIKRMGE